MLCSLLYSTVNNSQAARNLPDMFHDVQTTVKKIPGLSRLSFCLMKDMLPPYLKEQGRVEMLEEADWFG